MVSDEAGWRLGMLSQQTLMSSKSGTPGEAQKEIVVSKGGAQTTPAKEGETTAPALVDGELRFRVDPDYGFIEYRLSDDQVSLFGGSYAEYANNTIKADVIRYRVDDKLVWAEGRVYLTDPQQTLIGKRMSYDLNSKQGLVYQGDSEASLGYYSGDKVKWASNKVLYAQNGTFTTCDKEQPDYNFWSPRMKIVIDDQVVARPTVMYIGRVPVLALPYYYQSLRRDRHSGFLAPYVRYVSNQYFAVNNGYYWAINDFSDLTTRLNYNSKNGWQEQAYFVYLYGSKTSINSANFEHSVKRTTDVEWWSINWYHRQDISKETTLLGQINARNDSSYDRTFGEDFQSRTENSLNSFLTLTHRLENYSFTAELRRNQNISTDRSSTDPNAWGSQLVTASSNLPRLSISGTTQQIAETGIYYSVESSFINYYQQTRFTEGESNLYRRAIASGSLSRPLRFLGWLNYSPSINDTGQWDAWDILGEENIFLNKYTLSNGLNTKIYGIFPGEDGITVRHIISPTISHTYSPAISNETIYGSGISGLEQNYLSMSLGNALDIKLPDKSKDSDKTKDKEKDGKDTVQSKKASTYEGTRIDFMDLTTSIGYNFSPLQSSLNERAASSLLDPPSIAYSMRNWSDLTNSLRINPNFADWYTLTSQLAMSHDAYTWERVGMSITTSLGFDSSKLAKKDKEEDVSASKTSPGRYDPGETARRFNRLKAGEDMGEGFTLQFDHTYTPGPTTANDIHTIRGEVGFNLSHNWRIRYDNYYDLTDGKVISEHYRIYRDLHCWEAEIRISTERHQLEYWFQIRLKELPDFQLFGTRERDY